MCLASLKHFLSPCTAVLLATVVNKLNLLDRARRRELCKPYSLSQVIKPPRHLDSWHVSRKWAVLHGDLWDWMNWSEFTELWCRIQAHLTVKKAVLLKQECHGAILRLHLDDTGGSGCLLIIKDKFRPGKVNSLQSHCPCLLWPLLWAELAL